MEIWKQIEGFEGFYEVSSIGNIKSLYKDINRSLVKSNSGYYLVTLYKDGVVKNIPVHRIVAMAFIPNSTNSEQVNHKNGIKTDNRVENLEWVTRSENMLHAYKNRLCNKQGEENSNCKLTEDEVLQIYNSKESTKDISSTFKISARTVAQIKQGTRWAHVTNHTYQRKKRGLKLSDQDILRIYKMEGSYNEIANIFNVKSHTVRDIKLCRNWASITKNAI